MEYTFTLIDEQLDVTEMDNITKENTKTIKLLIDEIERLKTATNNEKEEYDYKEEVVVASVNNFDDISIEEDNLEEEIAYYYAKIKDGISLDEDSSLVDYLPSLKNPNYTNIVYGICSLVLKDINEIKEFIELEKEGLLKEELQDFKDEISFNQNLIKRITVANDEKVEESDSEEITLNNIVFLETSLGNVYAKEDINPNVIPSEYYDGFYELIKSIEDGTFKNVKMLTSGNNKTAGVSEVKSFKRRVIFDRVDFNTYVIIGVFTKKSDKDKSYMDPLINRIAIYKKRKDFIVENSKNSDYLEEQRDKLNEIYDILKPKKEAKVYLKGLGNDE